MHKQRDAVLISVQQSTIVTSALQQAKEKFERKVSRALSTLSEKKQTRLLLQVLASFKEYEVKYGPKLRWLTADIDAESEELIKWAVKVISEVEGECSVESAKDFIEHLLVFNESESDYSAFARWILDYPCGGAYGEESIPEDCVSGVIDELIGYVFREAHNNVWRTYVGLTSYEAAAEWILGRELRLEINMQKVGLPYRRLTFQESCELYLKGDYTLSPIQQEPEITNATPELEWLCQGEFTSDDVSSLLRHLGVIAGAPAVYHLGILNGKAKGVLSAPVAAYYVLVQEGMIKATLKEWAAVMRTKYHISLGRKVLSYKPEGKGNQSSQAFDDYIENVKTWLYHYNNRGQ